MASKVFVSPGVYTTETELSYVAQSVGVTTLGITGELLKGPAFEPIFITNYDEFQTYFGPTSPEKFVGTQIPKYEAAYIAKAYLQQSNQLFVTRVLGLSGYDAGPSWSITSIANVNQSTVGISGYSATGTFTLAFSGNTSGTVNFTTTGVGSWTGSPMSSIFTKSYTKFNGSTSTIQDDMTETLVSIFATNSLSATTAEFWGPISASTFSSLSSYTNKINSYGVNNLSVASIDYTADSNDPWYYATFNITTGENYSGFSFYSVVGSNFGTGTTAGSFTGSVSGTYFTFSGYTYSGYNNVVLATLRSRGISDYNSTSDGMEYQVTGTSNVSIITTGSYIAVQQNPYSQFLITGSSYDNSNFSFECSLDDTNANFISKVLGTGNFQKERVDVPLFVEERFPTLLYYGYNKGYVRGINSTLVSLPEAKNNNTTSIANYLERYQTSYSPWVVSELRGNTVFQLFRYIFSYKI